MGRCKKIKNHRRQPGVIVKEKESDNLIKLPTSGNQTEQPIKGNNRLPQPPDSNELILDLVEKNRKRGVEATEKRLDSLEERKTLEDPELESIIRDITGALRGGLTSVEALNSLSDFLKHDLIAAIQNVEQQSKTLWSQSAHLQTIINVLKEKDLVAEEELKAEWKKVVQGTRERVEAAQQEAKDEE